MKLKKIQGLINLLKDKKSFIIRTGFGSKPFLNRIIKYLASWKKRTNSIWVQKEFVNDFSGRLLGVLLN